MVRHLVALAVFGVFLLAGVSASEVSAHKQYKAWNCAEYADLTLTEALDVNVGYALYCNRESMEGKQGSYDYSTALHDWREVQERLQDYSHNSSKANWSEYMARRSEGVSNSNAKVGPVSWRSLFDFQAQAHCHTKTRTVNGVEKPYRTCH